MDPYPTQSTITRAEVEAALDQGRSLRGQTIGPLVFVRRTFDRPVDFHEAVFSDRVTFDEVTFKEPAVFSHAEFRGPANFRFCRFTDAFFTAARFRVTANFTGSRFGRAYFWRALFGGEALFFQTEVKPAAQESAGYLYPGEANFSFAIFRDKADFTRAHFYGKNFFFGTRFGPRVYFTEANFLDRVWFHEQRAWLCLVRGDFEDLLYGRWPGIPPDRFAPLLSQRHEIIHPVSGLFTQLLLSDIIVMSNEHLDHLSAHSVQYADFKSELSPAEVRERLDALQSTGRLDPEALSLFEALRADLTRPMFLEESDISFRNAHFSPQDDPHFKDADLRWVRFLGSGLERVRFQNITWDQQPMLFGKRAALYDEREAETQEALAGLGRLYGQLSANYQALGDTAAAEEFHFGAQEMQRRNGQGWRIFHKYLNGYNTSFVTAGTWLVLFLVIVFPAIYLALGTVDTLSDAVFHSLWLSNFLTDEVRYNPSAFSRAVQALEPLIVGFLAGMAGLVFKRKLWV
jgi:uncharacterized protein YjbI with pentapeptide repeats